jgi:pimeloyl-ACP methyl ester carboxylesterase
MDRDFSQYCYQKATYTSGYTDPGTGVSLFTVEFTPPEPPGSPVIVFVPGLASVPDNFTGTLIGLTRYHKVHYVETREKSSALISNNHGFSVAEVSSDLTGYLNSSFTDDNRYVLVGYSLGATAIAESFRFLKHKPLCLVLIEPNGSFNFPWWSVVLARGARYIFRFLKPFLKWYIRKFRVNTAEDNEMYLMNCRILDAAEPRRLGKTIRDLKPYRIGDCLEGISVPVMVAGASKDKFHSHDEALIISAGINNCTYADLEDNARSHSGEMAEVIIRFIKSVLTD